VHQGGIVGLQVEGDMGTRGHRVSRMFFTYSVRIFLIRPDMLSL
jgi:hypothetical protein